VREELNRTAHVSKRGGETAPAPREKVEETRAPVAKPNLIMSLKRMTKTMEPKPYIIVPRNSHGLINLLNAKRFLNDSIYDQPQGDLFTQFEKNVEVSHVINGEQMTFRVVDSVQNWTTKDWKLAVAVFIDGTNWQFASWPFKTHADLFATICGFHIQFDEALTPRYMHNAAGERYSAAAPLRENELDLETVPVARLRVKRAAATRHADALVAYQFWKQLEAFLLRPRKARFTSAHNL
jgi:hypothetical protein